MKTLFKILALFAFIAYSCTSSYKTTTVYDDVYYSPGDKIIEQPNATSTYKSTVYVNSDDGNIKEAAAQNNENYSDNSTYSNSSGSYIESDNYDYAYSARLRRFHSDYYFNSYYSPYYTNLYWYNYDPYYWGTSIYFGYNFWGPWGNNCYWSWNCGYPYSYYGYYYPHGYGSYWLGYNHGFYDGYWAGNHHNYYNSYDYNSNYYNGPRNITTGGRNARTGSNIVGNRVGGSANNNVTFKERYENDIRAGRITNYRQNSTAAVREIDKTNRGPRVNNGNEIRSSNNTEVRRYGSNNGVNSNQRPTFNSSRSGSIEPPPQPSGRQYINNNVNKEPIQAPNVRRGNTTVPNNNSINIRENNQRAPQSYRSPSYSSPKSSQEYTTPKYRNNSNTQENNYNSSPSPAHRSNSSYSAPTQSQPRSSDSYNSSGSSRGSSYSAPSSSQSSRSNDNSSNGRRR